jgi:hypothetical protein
LTSAFGAGHLVPAAAAIRYQRRRRVSLGRLSAPIATSGTDYVLWRRFPYPGGRGPKPLPPIKVGLPVRITGPYTLPPATATATAGTPVPVGFPVNQLFMAPDGSQWAYSQSQGAWLNVGTPYNLGQPAAQPPASTAAPAPSTSVTVSAPTPAPSSYQSLIDFATSSSLVGFLPNWVLGLGVVVGLKVLESRQAAGGRR